MDRRYQVFLSSTYEDLQKERNEVVKALLELDCIPCGMEYFPAASEDQWSYIKSLIDNCDYYVVVIAGKYGSLTDEGLSYTQQEYEYAVEKGIPVVAFIHRDPENLPSKFTEQDEAKRKKLEHFLKKVKKKLCKEWANADELGAVVSRSLTQLIRRTPRPGWVRADQVQTAEDSRKLLELSSRLIELEDENRMLKGADFEPDEGLAQGEEKLHLTGSYKILERGEHFYNSSEVGVGVLNVELTWSDIFKALLPRFQGGVTENSAKSYVNSLAFECLPSSFHTDLEPKFVRSVSVDQRSFNLIKVQLLALGFIDISQIDSGEKKVRQWFITPKGTKKMYSLLAVRNTETEKE